MPRTWEDLREGLRREVFRRGVDDVAADIPADRVTVYRIINGTTERPTRAVQAGVLRIVADATGGESSTD